MYEELYTPLPDAGAYLERLGLGRVPKAPDEEYLTRLVRAQLTRIPFENIDIWGSAVCPSLATEDLFKRIVIDRRGGYCFELNSLFCALLRALGYEAYTVAVYVVESRAYLPPPSHCAIICTIDGRKFFVDVGFGGPVPNGPLPLDGSEGRHGFYLRLEGSFYALYSHSGCVMRLRDVPAAPVDLVPLNFFISQDAGSKFRRELNVNLRLPDGAAYIQDRRFKYHSKRESIDRTITSAGELRGILGEYFGIPAGELIIPDIFSE